uniref:Uncharacterized protein n=1 Tax=Vespula pensylvanica TaxID=30213 RepID=A0A834PFT7_VESPE|nr:hypothetical protein H0235_001305 [Vespula pensylvanica]
MRLKVGYQARTMQIEGTERNRELKMNSKTKGNPNIQGGAFKSEQLNISVIYAGSIVDDGGSGSSGGGSDGDGGYSLYPTSARATGIMEVSLLRSTFGIEEKRVQMLLVGRDIREYIESPLECQYFEISSISMVVLKMARDTDTDVARRIKDMRRRER